MKVYVEKHTTINKRFDIIINELRMFVDYDDVNHAQTDADIRQVKEIVDKYWNYSKQKEYLKEEIIKTWEKNEYDLQSDYDDEGGFEGFLKGHGF